MTQVFGTCDPAFSNVKAEFEKNFAERGEVGASVALSVNGEKAVDLWGGIANKDTGEPWQEDTVSIVFSCTKAATALCAHMLIDQGKLNLNAKVAQYWPEFATNGKESTTVSMMLNHESGVPALREPVKEGGVCDWEYMCERLAAEEPFWEPGTRNGYHMISFGWTVGELVRRVSGKSLGAFFAENIAGPLGMRYWIGLPEDETPHIAPILLYEPQPSDVPGEFATALLGDPASIPHLSVLNVGGWNANQPEAHRAEIGGAGGITNARNQVKMYEQLAMGGGTLVSKERLDHMSRVATATARDATLKVGTRFGPGFMKSMDNRGAAPGNQDSVLLGDRAFGHVGAGGSIGFADPECGLAFSYTMNQMGPGILMNARGQSLIDEAYRALGYTSNTSGAWMR